jgi:isoleucyl-tRNA synthetase
VVDLGRSARAAAAVRTRQPLSAMVVFAAGWADLPGELRALAREELNVVEEATLDEVAHVIDRVAKPNFRALGRRFGARTKEVAAAISVADVATLQGSRPVLRVGAEEVEIEPGDFTVTEAPREGWTVAGETGLTVALDVRLTPALLRAGFAREVVRLIQEARKTSGLDVADRIELWWEADGEVARAVTEHSGLIAAEVLAVSVQRGRPAADIAPHRSGDLGLTFWLRGAGG